MTEPAVPKLSENAGRAINAAFFIVIGTHAFKHWSSQVAAFSIILTLAIIGGVLLWDQDRWRKAGQKYKPFILHILAMLFAVCVSAVTNPDVHRGLPPLLVRIFVCSFLATIFFLLMEFATHPSVRKDESQSLPASTCILTYLIATPNQLFDIERTQVDWTAVALFIAGLSAGGVSMFSRDLDSVPLERRYLYIWFGISMAVFLNWMIRPF